MTTYVILRAIPAPDSWHVADVFDATSAEQACRMAATEMLDDDSTDLDGGVQLVAVPQRSWQPVTLHTEARIKAIRP